MALIVIFGAGTADGGTAHDDDNGDVGGDMYW